MIQPAVQHTAGKCNCLQGDCNGVNTPPTQVPVIPAQLPLGYTQMAMQGYHVAALRLQLGFSPYDQFRRNSQQLPGQHLKIHASPDETTHASPHQV
jgi:hypothetical protein